MDTFSYLFQANLYMILFYGFYYLVLRNETFFSLNRVFLVASGVIPFFIPLMRSDWLKTLSVTGQVSYAARNVNVMLIYPPENVPEEHGWPLYSVLYAVYVSGVALLCCKFLWQLARVRKVLRAGGSTRAFSFFKIIVIPAKLPHREVIMDHEQVHSRQWHSADVLLFELLAIFNWFNPVVYAYKRSIMNIHEFIADAVAAGKASSKADYAILLLSNTFGIDTNALTNNFFNRSLLKRRLIMLNKAKSARTALPKYGLSAPLFAAMLILSSASVKNTSAVRGVNQETVQEPQQEKPVDFSVLDTQPEYPGGMRLFHQYIAKNLKYTPEAREKKVSGKIYLNFIVEKNGNLSSIKVLRGLGYGLDAEAVRLLQHSPAWTPGMKNGAPVRVLYNLPIVLNLGPK